MLSKQIIGPTRLRGIALFGGNFILPFENQHQLSNCLSVKYLNICQKFNSSLPSTPSSKHLLVQNNQQEVIELPHKILEYVVLAPRQTQSNYERDSYYDIATRVQLEKCPETGAIKAVSRGVDSLVRIVNKTPVGTSHFSQPEVPVFTKDNRVIVNNDPRKGKESFVNVNDMPYLIQKQRKLFFCDYETLHSPDEVCVYSQEQVDTFAHYINYLAKSSGYSDLSNKEYVTILSRDKNALFPRLQLLQLLKHFDQKYYYTYRQSSWLQKKYEILSNKDDYVFLSTLLNIQDYFKNKGSSC